MSNYQQPNITVVLEKKGRGRGLLSFVKPWTTRTFKLRGYALKYYDGEKLKGSVDMKGSQTLSLAPTDADGKEFPFAVRTVDETIMLSAHSEEVRESCIVAFNEASNWMAKAAEAASNQASTAAVVDLMKGNMETKKLKEENDKLEKERLQQHTAVAASVFSENEANAQLKKAAESEAKQREEQERQLVEMMKGLGAKNRMREAVKHGKTDIAREAAAVMAQAAWKSRQARKRMEIHRKDKEHLKASGYARKIQSRYRSRLAGKRVRAIKEEQQRNLQKIMVIKIQNAVRKMKARRLLYEKKEAKKIANRGISVAVLQKVVRRLLAVQRVKARRRMFPTIVKVTVEEVIDNAGTLPYCDYQAVTSGAVVIHSKAALSPKAGSNSSTTTVTAVKKDAPLDDLHLSKLATSSSVYRIEKDNFPQESIATALNELQYVAVSIVNPTNGKCLGQSVVRLAEHFDGSRSRAQACTKEIEVKLQSLVVPVNDEVGKEFVSKQNSATLDPAAKTAPAVKMTITLPSPAHSMCGWIWKVSESVLSRGWKKRWFVLVDGYVTYYNSDCTLEQPKNAVACAAVTSIENIQHKGRSGLELKFQVDKGEGGAGGVQENSWMISWDEREPLMGKNMWLRKLYRNCQGVPDVNGLSGKVRLEGIKRQQQQQQQQPLGGSGAGGSSSEGTRSAPSVQAGRTKVPVMKRMSMLGGPSSSSK